MYHFNVNNRNTNIISVFFLKLCEISTQKFYDDEKSTRIKHHNLFYLPFHNLYHDSFYLEHQTASFIKLLLL